MSVYLAPVGNGQVFLTSTGLPANNGYIYTYQAGTTTPAVTYTTSLGNVANTYPIRLTPAGMAPAEIWLTGGQAYKFVVTDVFSNPIGVSPYDNLYGINDPQAGGQTLPATSVTYTPPGAGAVATTVGAKLSRGIVDIVDYGAKCDGVTNDIAAINEGLTYLAVRGGGILRIPVSNVLTDPFVLPDYVTLAGMSRGPLIAHALPSGTTTVGGTCLLVNSTASTFVTLQGECSSIEDLAIYYPQQVAPSAAAPNAYPYSVTMPNGYSGGNMVRRCIIINAYDGIYAGNSGFLIEDTYVGAFHNDFCVDDDSEVAHIVNCKAQVMWDIFANLSYPQNIDAWVMSNSIGAMRILRADNLNLANFACFNRQYGMVLTDSPLAGSPKNSYGKATNIDLDTVKYGIYADSTDNVGFGWKMANVDIGSDGTGITGVYCNTGGGSAPDLLICGGSIRGTWSAGTYVRNAGNLIFRDFQGIKIGANSVPGPVAAPVIPASGTPLANPYAMRCQVCINGGTFTGSAVQIGGTSTGNPNSPQVIILDPYETVTLNYSSAPTWLWFALQ